MTSVEPVTRGAIRQATRADLLDVFRIEKAVFPHPWPFSAFERYLDEPGFLVHETSTGHSVGDAGAAAESDEQPGEGRDEEVPNADAGRGGVSGNVVGFVVATTIPNHRRPLGHVKDLAVAPGRQSEGIGSTILRRGLGALAAHGVRSAKLEVRRSNERAIGLYRRAGFEYHRTLPRYYSDGEDALVLVANLADRDTF